MSHALKRLALALLLFVSVYAPAFALVARLHPSVKVTIPLIIAVSASITAICMALFAKQPKGIAEFGFARSPFSYIIAATAAGVVIGVVFAYIAALYPGHSPLDLSTLQPWMIVVYFVIAAPIQEELIFRAAFSKVWLLAAYRRNLSGPPISLSSLPPCYLASSTSILGPS
jgi:membrane protease YdiL (CAAX protease family)